MITTALLILIFAFIFAGVGLLIPVAGFSRDHRFASLLAAFWTGFALILAFLQVWQLFFKVDWIPLVGVIVAGGSGWFSVRRHLRGITHGVSGLAAVGGVVLILLPALILANHVMFVPAHSDHGLYHLQTVKWLASYAIVPGLGNLHHRLAFNNANFLEAALLNAGPLAGRSYYLANTLLAYVLILQCIGGVLHLLRAGDGTHRLTKVHLYDAFMLAPVLWHLSTTHLPGYSPDVPVFALQVVLGGELLRLAELGTDRGRFIPQMRYLALLSAAGIAVKLSFVVFGALILLAGIGFWLARLGFHRSTDGRVWAAWVGVAALLGVPWLVRGGILSGYLLYPSTALPLPVAWRIPLHLAQPVAGVITTWARTASAQIAYTGDWAWFLNWLRFFPYEPRLAFLMSLVLLALEGLGAVMLHHRGSRNHRENRDHSALLLLGISALSMAYWFVMAPDYRFSGAIIWIFLVSVLLIGYTQLTEAQIATTPAMLATGVVIILAVGLSPNQFSKNFSLRLLLNPVPEPVLAARYQPPDQAQVRLTASGLKVYTPANGGQDCWNLPLPCTPSQDFTQQLHLFVPGDLQKGFYIKK